MTEYIFIGEVNQTVMKAKKKVDLAKVRGQTINALGISQLLSRAQLTMGPLRYVSPRQRKKILAELVDEELVQEEIIGGRGSTGRGCPRTKQYRLTEKGQLALR